MFQYIKRTVILAVFSSVVGLMGIAPVAADQTYRDVTLTGTEQRPLAFSQSKQLVLGDHDDKQRQRMHIFSWLILTRQLPNAQHV